MEYKQEIVCKIPVTTVAEFATQHKCTPVAIYSAIKEDMVDWMQVGAHAKLILLTDKTKEYAPNRKR